MESDFDQFHFTSTAELIEESHIYKLPVVSLILAALLDNSFLSSEHSKARLTNNHVVKLAGSSLPDSVVVRVILEIQFVDLLGIEIAQQHRGIVQRDVKPRAAQPFCATDAV